MSPTQRFSRERTRGGDASRRRGRRRRTEETHIEMELPAAGDESSPTRPLWTQLHPIETDGEVETRDGTIQVEGGGAEGDGE